MARRIMITAGEVSATALLDDSPTADLVWAACPLESTAKTWGDEVYFDTPIEASPDDLQATVELGALAYWPPGQAFCIFFGPTPMSSGAEIRPASPVSVFGNVEGDAALFRSVRSGARITVEREP